MALFMLQGSYTSEAWAAQLKNPQDRRPVFRGLVEKFGGTLRDAYLTLGESDIVVIYEAPDAKAAAGIGMALAGAGHVKSVKTTAMVSVEDAVEAMRKAGDISYQTPGR